MTNKLIISPHKPSSKASFTYDWESITDLQHRDTAKVLIDSLHKAYEQSIKEVEQVAKRYTNALSRTVYSLKQQLPHGLFQSVCRQALNLNDDQMACYVQIGQYIDQGAVLGKALEMVNLMEPRAASKLLKAPDEVKGRYVATFEATGKVPSQRDFNSTTKPHEPPEPRSERPPVTNSIEEARRRIVDNNIHLAHACGAIAELLKKQNTASNESKNILRFLRMQIDYLLNT